MTVMIPKISRPYKIRFSEKAKDITLPYQFKASTKTPIPRWLASTGMTRTATAVPGEIAYLKNPDTAALSDTPVAVSAQGTAKARV
jgi:hypothetical protein